MKIKAYAQITNVVILSKYRAIVADSGHCFAQYTRANSLKKAAAKIQRQLLKGDKIIAITKIS